MHFENGMRKRGSSNFKLISCGYYYLGQHEIPIEYKGINRVSSERSLKDY